MPLSRIKTNSITNPLVSPTIITPTINGAAYSGLNFKNKVINGNFDVWQRGTSLTINGAGSYYYADRFLTYSDGASATRVVSRQDFTMAERNSGVEPAANSQYYHRVVFTPSGNNILQQFHKIEGLRQFAGKTVTVSFYAKASTNVTSNMFLYGYSGTGSEEGYMSGMTANNYNITTSWQKFTFTITIPQLNTGWSYVNGESLIIYFTQLSSSSAVTLDYSQIQLELGSTATPFELRPLGVEVALCQRYYWNLRSSQGNLANFNLTWYSSRARSTLTAPVTMRTGPTVSLVGSTTGAFFSTNDDSNYRNFNYNGAYVEQGSGVTCISLNFVDSGGGAAATGGGVAYIQNSRTLEVSAEL